MQKITASMVIAGLEIGLLVRGGMTRGKLYHRNRVIAGPALVDAHRLESITAKFPRVVVSPKLEGARIIIDDVDGGRVLEYFTEMIMILGDNAVKWAEHHLELIEMVIEQLKKHWKMGEAEKWAISQRKLGLNKTLGETEFFGGVAAGVLFLAHLLVGRRVRQGGFAGRAFFAAAERSALARKEDRAGWAVKC